MARTLIIVGTLTIDDDDPDGVTDATDPTGLTADAHLALMTGQLMPDGKPFPYGAFQWTSTAADGDIEPDDVLVGQFDA